MMLNVDDDRSRMMRRSATLNITARTQGFSGVFCALLCALLSIAPPLSSQAREGKVDKEQLQTDLVRLQSFSDELKDLANEMETLKKRSKRRKRGHFTASEHDSIESVLFRYMICRNSLWALVNRYRNYPDMFKDADSQTRAFVIGFNAALHLAAYSSMLIRTFQDSPAVVAKLNERYHRIDIEEGTWDRIFKNVTRVEHLQALRAAWTLYEAEIKDADSTLVALKKTDAKYRAAIAQIKGLHKTADANIEFILKQHSLILPGVRNRIRHTAIVEIAKKARKKFSGNLYAIRGLLFVNVSRIKHPTSELVSFSGAQLKEIKERLQPGDIILTFTEGFMSNIFLPGVFKHGLTYVGTPEQRKAFGLSIDAVTGIPKGKRDKLRADLRIGKLSSGHAADVVEAVAEGVIFNSFEYLLQTHINRVVVLRPRLTPEARRQALLNVFLLLGNKYDFKFDFNSASHQCCTEVIYRAFDGRGSIKFALVERMGRQTLSADDIVSVYLGKNSPFELVLLAEEDPKSKTHKAIVRKGSDAEKRLKSLFKALE